MMFTKLIAKFGFAIGCILAVITYLGLSALSWIITCGFIYLITLCFGWAFSWAIATGIWLVWLLINMIFEK